MIGDINSDVSLYRRKFGVLPGEDPDLCHRAHPLLPRFMERTSSHNEGTISVKIMSLITN